MISRSGVKLRLKYLLLSFLILSGTGDAEAIQAVVTRNTFYAPTGTGQLEPYLEAYWQIDPQTILFRKENESWQGKIRTDIRITGPSGVVREEHYILATTPVSEGEAVYTQRIIDLRRYGLAPGRFRIQVDFRDEYKKDNVFQYTDSFEIAAPSRVMFSDIQLVDTLIHSDRQDIFQRNGRLQVPLCTNFLDESRQHVRYYAELYHTELVSADVAPLIRRVFISKKEMDQPLNDIVETDTVTPALLQIVEGTLPVRSLGSGNYYLNVSLEDRHGTRLAGNSLFLQILNSNPETLVSRAGRDSSGTADAPTFLNLNKTFLGKYTPSQVRAILKMLLPIADPNERNSINGFIKTPDDTYARYFIYNFWLKRNKLKPEEAWKEYADRVKVVNKLFGSAMLNGYENDRGMIYLKYGAPTERVVVENENGAIPYEVWQYNSVPNNTNAMFLFYRPGFVTNDFKLLHTTVNGEVRNKAWRLSLYRNGEAFDVHNSRAEQYLGNR